MADFNTDFILKFCQNKINSTTLTQMTKDEKFEPVDVDLFEYEYSSIGPFNQQQHVFYYIFRLGLYLTLNRVSLSGYQGVTRLDGARGKKQIRRPPGRTPWSEFGAPMIKSEFFRTQIYCVEESTCDMVGTFRRLQQ